MVLELGEEVVNCNWTVKLWKSYFSRSQRRKCSEETCIAKVWRWLVGSRVSVLLWCADSAAPRDVSSVFRGLIRPNGLSNSNLISLREHTLFNILIFSPCFSQSLFWSDCGQSLLVMYWPPNFYLENLLKRGLFKIVDVEKMQCLCNVFIFLKYQ